MKKITFILATMLVVMLSGCGEGSSSSSTEDGVNGAVNNNRAVQGVKGLTEFPAVPAIPAS